MSVVLFAILVVLGTVAIVLLLWRWLRRWARFSLRSLVLFVLAIAATGALVVRDLSEERVLIEHGHIWHSALSTDGSRLAMGHAGFTEVWDTKTADCTDGITDIADQSLTFGPEGNVLVFGNQADVRVLGLTDLPFRVVPGPAKGFGVFSPSGQILATGSAERICLWSWPDLVQIGALEEGLGSTFRDVVWSPDGSRIAVSETSGVTAQGTTTRVWSVRDHRLLYTVAGGRPCYSPDGQVLATVRTNWIGAASKEFCVKDASLMLWDADGGTPRGELASDSGICDITFSRDGGLLLTGGMDKLCAWDLATGQCTASYRWRRASTIGSGPVTVSSMVDLPDRQGLLCVSDWDPRLYRWDYRAPWASHPFLGYVEFWLLAVLGFALLVSLVQDVLHFRKVRKEAEAAREPAAHSGP